MPNALDTLRSLRAIGHRGGALTAFARRFTAAPALFTPDDGDDGASNEPQPADIVRIDVMGHTQYYPGASPSGRKHLAQRRPAWSHRHHVSPSANP